MQTQSKLRLAALGGLGAALLWNSTQLHFDGAFGWSLVITSVLAALVFAAMFRLAPDGWQHLQRHPDILVPLGIMVGVLALIDALLATSPGLATPWFSLKLWMIAFPITAGLLFSLVVHAVFAIWTTVLVVDIIQRDRCDLGDAFLRTRPVAIRLLLVLVVGWSLSMLLYGIEVPLLLGLGFVFAKVLGSLTVVLLWAVLLAVLAWRFLINLATAALLPVLAECESDLFSATYRGIAESWRNRRKWFTLLLAQFVLAGAYGMVHFKYAHQSGGGYNNTNVNVSLNFAAPWLGDYEYDDGWYSHAMGRLEREKLAFVTALVAMLSALLSIVVKLAIFERLTSRSDTETGPPSDTIGKEMDLPPPGSLREAEFVSRET